VFADKYGAWRIRKHGDFEEWHNDLPIRLSSRHSVKSSTPIYPPPGFGGKSGAELWNAVFGGVDDGGRPYPGVAYLVSHLPGQEPYQTPCVLITQYIIINLKHSSFTSDEVPRYILALQNALVLSACLEAHNAT
jgi:hypothetical protein